MLDLGNEVSSTAHLGSHKVLDIRYDVFDTDMLRIVHPERPVALLGILCGKLRSWPLFAEVDRKRVFDLRLFKRNRFDCDRCRRRKHYEDICIE